MAGAEVNSLLHLQHETRKKEDLNIFKINGANIEDWLSKSHIARKSVNVKLAQEVLTSKLNVEIGDSVVVHKRESEASSGWTYTGRLRVAAAKILAAKDLLDLKPNLINFLWVEKFPLFMRDQETGELFATHHPFTSPLLEDLEVLLEQPEKARAQHYDLTLDGEEIGGGSIRVHSPELQRYILKEVLKIADIERAGFQHLINALSSGCPPHGGIALGFDRLMALLLGAESIRDVIAFPKAHSGSDLLVGSPSPIDEERLTEYGIKVE